MAFQQSAHEQLSGLLQLRTHPNVFPALETVAVEERKLQCVGVVLAPALADVCHAPRVKPLPAVYRWHVWILPIPPAHGVLRSKRVFQKMGREGCFKGCFSCELTHSPGCPPPSESGRVPVACPPPSGSIAIGCFSSIETSKNRRGTTPIVSPLNLAAMGANQPPPLHTHTHTHTLISGPI